MNTDKPVKWKRFQKLRFDKRHVLRRMRTAERATTQHAHRFVLRRWRNVREVRRLIAAWMLAVGCLVAAAGLQHYWDQQAYHVSAGEVGSTYAEGLIGSVDNLNPLFANSPATEAVTELVFSRLMTYDTTGNLNYDLTRDVTVSDDSLTYTVQLRNDVRWHDGEKLTADDVVFTTELLRDSTTRSTIRGWDSIKVKKVDDYTVSFQLATAYAPFLSALTFPIVPHHLLDGVAHDAIEQSSFGQSPVGSGPFAFRLLQDIKGSEGRRAVHLVANQQYYRGAPKLARFQLHTYPTQDALKRALEIGEVNAASGLTRAIGAQLSEQRFVVTEQPIQSGVYAFINTSSELLTDKTIRKALQLATNIDEVRSGLGPVTPLDSPYTTLQLSGAPKPPAADLAAAQKLLSDAGWVPEGSVRKKDGRELRISVVTTKNDDYEKVLEVLKGQWSRLGVIVDERVIDASDPSQNFVQSVLQPRSYDVLIYQLALGRDPDVYAYWHSSQAVARGLNLSNYDNPAADDNLSSARSSKDAALRDAKHRAFAKVWLDDVPAIGLYQSAVVSASTKRVSGMNVDNVLVSPQQRYNDVIYWTVGERTVYKTP